MLAVGYLDRGFGGGRGFLGVVVGIQTGGSGFGFGVCGGGGGRGFWGGVGLGWDRVGGGSLWGLGFVGLVASGDAVVHR
ncbi:hypothetical protein RJT34_13894 [Clitoria ternatea]|uniref:Uncharacterized protein n=1 Tax=Clitoria ternatea TaxID=43366 RepID=A0AAN9JPE2_CLITE